LPYADRYADSAHDDNRNEDTGSRHTTHRLIGFCVSCVDESLTRALRRLPYATPASVWEKELQ